MPFIRYTSAVVASPVGQPTLPYVIRNDTNQIAALDTTTEGPVDFAVYYPHPVTGDAQNRSLRKKVVRIDIFGEGAINPALGSAYMIVVCDEQRSDVYPFSLASPNPAEGILWSQNTLRLEGRQIDVCLLLTGVGLKIRGFDLGHTVVG